MLCPRAVSGIASQLILDRHWESRAADGTALGALVTGLMRGFWPTPSLPALYV
jgi:hypothetical protein